VGCPAMFDPGRNPNFNPKEVREHLTGSIASINMSFDGHGGADYRGLRNEIDLVVEAGSKTVLLTGGDSGFACLSDEGIGEVTEAACQYAAAGRLHSTSRAVEFAQFARDPGADFSMVHMAQLRNWASSCMPQTLTVHY